ncbi:uncharacterized protein LOC113495232 [Trichoplusia ni]|uniref:Uncharacterized protein LOC113495232 n=1 Tax=Trichoplusia ni TaxID=7111 RepID=A0A7E5VN05_TRINI|nr:uncharacterized protein LOC113495232 [Trichoplusia ni]
MSFLYVKVYYGPCNTFHNNVHKPQMLNGLRERLQMLGFRVDLHPVDHVNYCMIEMCGHEIFRCNIRQLKFNTSYTADRVCRRAVEAVVQSSVKFQRTRTYLWFWALIEKQMFQRTKYAPKEVWLTKSMQISKPCTKCHDCCDLDTKERRAIEEAKMNPVFNADVILKKYDD